MSKRLLMGPLTALLIMQAPVTGLAQTMEPSQAAEQAVLDGRQVDIRQLQQFGSEYLNNYLSAYHRASLTYQQAYQAGLNDGHQHRFCPPSNLVGKTAYQRAWQVGQTVTDNQQSNNEQNHQPANSVADEATYPARQPLPNQAHFINQIAPLAQEVGNKYDLYPSIIIAQAALESNWGGSDLSRAPYWNLFGVKGQYQGKAVMQPTTEFLRSQEQQVADRFRSYPNARESLIDYAKTLQDPLYDQVHRSRCHHYREATHALLGKYATDPHYDRKLNRIIDQYQLTRYDHQQALTDSKQPVKSMNHHWTTPVLKSDQPHHQHPVNKQSVSPVVSVIGGAGTAGILGILRRLIMK